MSLRCLVVDEMHASIVHLFEGTGLIIDYAPRMLREQVLEQISGYEGIVVRSKLRLDRNFFARATRLRFVARAGAGMDNIDIASATAAGVVIFNAPEGNRDAVAEHTIGLLLALLNRICQADAEVKAGLWLRTPNRGHELGGKTVALIGYGNMGRAVAARLQSFGCQVLAHDKYLKDWPDYNAIPATMEAVHAQADIVSLHVPLTYETRDMCNARWFRAFKKPIWLINTARGEVVSLLDLHYYIKTLRVHGAALDVLENEKPG